LIEEYLLCWVSLSFLQVTCTIRARDDTVCNKFMKKFLWGWSTIYLTKYCTPYRCFEPFYGRGHVKHVKTCAPCFYNFFHNFGNSYARVSGRVSSCSLSPLGLESLSMFSHFEEGKIPLGFRVHLYHFGEICSVEESSAQNI